MQYDIRFYQAVLEGFKIFKKMVEAETHDALSIQARTFAQNLTSSCDDVTETLERNISYLRFWKLVLDDDWARKLYYSFPERKEDKDGS